MKKTIIFKLEGKVIPKARPRDKTFHLPTKYRNWKAEAAIALALQSENLTTIDFPITIEVYLVGKHRGDADNIVGAIMDALQDAQIIKNDASIKEICLKAYKDKQPCAVIKLEPFKERNLMEDAPLEVVKLFV